MAMKHVQKHHAEFRLWSRAEILADFERELDKALASDKQTGFVYSIGLAAEPQRTVGVDRMLTRDGFANMLSMQLYAKMGSGMFSERDVQAIAAAAIMYAKSDSHGG